MLKAIYCKNVTTSLCPEKKKRKTQSIWYRQVKCYKSLLLCGVQKSETTFQIGYHTVYILNVFLNFHWEHTHHPFNMNSELILYCYIRLFV